MDGLSSSCASRLLDVLCFSEFVGLSMRYVSLAAPSAVLHRHARPGPKTRSLNCSCDSGRCWHIRLMCVFAEAYRQNAACQARGHECLDAPGDFNVFGAHSATSAVADRRCVP